MQKVKSAEQVQDAIKEKAINRTVDKKPQEDLPEILYKVSQSNVMHKCPACSGEPDLVRDCHMQRQRCYQR